MIDSITRPTVCLPVPDTRDPGAAFQPRKPEAPARRERGRLRRKRHRHSRARAKQSDPGYADRSKVWLARRTAPDRHPGTASAASISSIPKCSKRRRSPGSRPPRPFSRPNHPQTTAKVRGFALTAARSTAETDWVLERDGFEPESPGRERVIPLAKEKRGTVTEMTRGGSETWRP
jgi:hypothetical protein